MTVGLYVCRVFAIAEAERLLLRGNLLFIVFMSRGLLGIWGACYGTSRLLVVLSWEGVAASDEIGNLCGALGALRLPTP